MKKILLFIILLNTLRPYAADYEYIKKRADEIKIYLTEKPAFFTAFPVKKADRDKIKDLNEIKSILNKADELAGAPLPSLTEALYMEYSNTGNRTGWEKAASARNSRIKVFVIAECIENQGKYIDPLEKLLTEICGYKTWVRPAHDKSLDNYNQKKIEIDLESAELSWELSIAVYLLQDKLKPEIIKLVKDNINKRVFTPYKKMISGELPEMWWMRGENNWNAVCLAGVTGSALTILESKEERAIFTAAAEFFSQYYLKGFKEDGYCTEGVGYWNYGFGNYMLLSEIIKISTEGKIDLLLITKVKKIAEYGFNIEITDNVIPAFADCSINDIPEKRMLYLLSRRLNIPLNFNNKAQIKLANKLTQYALMFLFADIDQNDTGKIQNRELRTYFKDQGILINRALNPGDDTLTCGLQGGNNGDSHNHNDIGSFVIAVGTEAVLLDPGAETYTARTFSSARYESKALNSFGHSVPVIAGQLQLTGPGAKASIIKNEFSAEKDIFTMDIKSAYAVIGLKKIEREFIYSRNKNGSLEITDTLEAGIPLTFETALITMGNYKILDKNTLLIYGKAKALLCKIDCGADDFTVTSEIIKEDFRSKAYPVRICVKLNKSVKNAYIKISFEPYIIDNVKMPLNGNFEYFSMGWDIDADSMGEIVKEKASDGQNSLKIIDDSDKKGSNINSAPIPVIEKSKYQIKLKADIISGDSKAMGIYIKFFDKEENMLNKTDDKKNISSIITLGGKNGKWEEYSADFETPENTAYISIWLHSFNSAKTELYIDEINIHKL